MRTILLATVLLAAAPQESVQRFGLGPDGVRDTLFSDLTAGALYPPGVSAELRGLDIATRVAAVKALGVFAKAYFGSSDFKQRYAKYRAEQIGEPPRPVQSVDAIVAQRRAETEKSLAQSEEAAKQLPAAQQAEFKKIIAQMRQANEKALADRDAIAQLEQARFQGETAAYQRRQQKIPENPMPLLRAELQRFLDATADIDFGAKLVARGAKSYFVEEKYEAKPEPWKYAFRAGREPVKAARAFAQAWLNELK